MASGKNTLQYKKMQAMTPCLTSIIADGMNVIVLAKELSKDGLINKSCERRMMNTAVDADIRAADLVGRIIAKVGLNSKNFDTFIKVLEKDEASYGEVLTNLRKDSTCK